MHLYKKIAIFIALAGILLALDQVLVLLSATLFGPVSDWPNNLMVEVNIVHALWAYVSYILLIRFLKGEEFPKFRIKNALKHIFIGLSVALIMLALCLLLTPEFYHAKSGFHMLSWEQIFIPLLHFITGGIIEEVIYRGILQRFLSWFLPVYIATAIQIALFVQSHAPSILGHSSPILRIIGLSTFALLATIMAKRSQYLMMPIAFHIAENFFTTLIRGWYSEGWEIPGIWVYQDSLRIEYRPIMTIFLCLAVWYWFKFRKPDNVGIV